MDLQQELQKIGQRINDLQEGSNALLAFRGGNLSDEDKANLEKNNQEIEKLVFEQEWLQFENFCEAIQNAKKPAEKVELNPEKAKQLFEFAQWLKSTPASQKRKEYLQKNPEFFDIYFDIQDATELEEVTQAVAEMTG